MVNWPPPGCELPYPDNADQRTELANAILRANHRCIECGEPLGAPVFDEGEWIPDSVHLPDCPVLEAASRAMILEYLDVIDALHRVGYGTDYGNPVPRFGEVAA